MTKRALVSVCIPAYSNPELLERLLKSILEQSYRPIEINVVDDCSPINLSEICNQFSKEDGNEISLKYFRNRINLGTYLNLFECIGKASGEYLLQIDHDDWLFDDRFIEEAVNLFQSNTNLSLVIGNSQLEDTSRLSLRLDLGDKFTSLKGESFLRKHLYSDLHPARSGVIMNYTKLKSSKYSEAFLPKSTIERYQVHPDEAFGLLSILATLGDVEVSSRVVSVRGNPPNSFSKSVFWSESAPMGLVFSFDKLASYFFTKRNVTGFIVSLRNAIVLYPVRYKDLFQLRFLSFPFRIKVVTILNFIFQLITSFPKRCLHSAMYRSKIVKKFLSKMIVR
jgi:glycosyltransferase involved in cell wall biosynthesis